MKYHHFGLGDFALTLEGFALGVFALGVFAAENCFVVEGRFCAEGLDFGTFDKLGRFAKEDRFGLV